ncbi:hypothetical protein M9H77_30643 [Catharanthus roseus]|uniref:Uncharacterized protein n=1 Tax=Catharanthus roseus TaxID=4058 RepID=A0ACB9ZY81_CATRO|nr:hypothetical protein M9H77_30643 [Catharanthus roseus]
MVTSHIEISVWVLVDGFSVRIHSECVPVVWNPKNGCQTFPIENDSNPFNNRNNCLEILVHFVGHIGIKFLDKVGVSVRTAPRSAENLPLAPLGFPELHQEEVSTTVGSHLTIPGRPRHYPHKILNIKDKISSCTFTVLEKFDTSVELTSVVLCPLALHCMLFSVSILELCFVFVELIMFFVYYSSCGISLCLERKRARRTLRTLPSNTEVNPKEHVNAISATINEEILRKAGMTIERIYIEEERKSLEKWLKKSWEKIKEC